MKKHQFVPGTPDGLEDRVVLSTASLSPAAQFQVVPTLTTRTFNNVVSQVDKAFSRLAKSGDIHRLQSDLVAAASKLPYGRQDLLPTWLNEVASISDRATAGQAYQAVRADLAAYVQDGVNSGTFRFR